MTRFSVAVCSDVHLSQKVWTHLPIFGDSYYSWHQIVKQTIQQKCDLLIIAGDLLDKQANVSRPIRELLLGLRKLKAAGIPVYYNQGQHEYQDVPWMSLAPNASWLDKGGTLLADGCMLDGCDYRNTDDLQQFLQSERAKAADILVCHQVWRDFMGDNAKPQGEFADVPENVQLLITGDFHEAIYKKFGNLKVLSPGSTHMRSISEPQDKSFFNVGFDTNEKRTFEVKICPLVTRRCLHLDSRAFTQTEELFQQANRELEQVEAYADKHDMPECVRTPLLRLTHDVGDDKRILRFKREFRERAHLFFKPIRTVTEGQDALVAARSVDATERSTMLSCLEHFDGALKQDGAKDLAVQMLQGGDPEQTLNRWIQTRLKG